MCFYIIEGKGVAEMKKEYIAPTLEMIQFDISDIITHSNAINDGEGVNKPRPRGERSVVTINPYGEFIVN